MRDPFQGYDQWKTASPYDDQPDPNVFDEARRFIEYQNDDGNLIFSENWTPQQRLIRAIQDLAWAIMIIDELLEHLEE